MSFFETTLGILHPPIVPLTHLLCLSLLFFSHARHGGTPTKKTKTPQKRIAKQQVCLTSDKGFQDFNVLMKSGIISNVNMNGKFAEHLNELCKVLVPRLIDLGVAERMAEVDKLYDYNLQLDLCQKIVPACGQKKNKKKGGGDGGKSGEPKKKKKSRKTRTTETVVEEEEEAVSKGEEDDVDEGDTIEL